MNFSALDGRRIGVWGLGRETLSLIDQLRRRLPAARVTVIVDDQPVDLARARDLAGPDVTVASGDDLAAALLTCDVVVRSPGVSIYGPAATAVREAGIPLTTATALWMAEDRARPAIAITGTKGKSTTSLLTAHLARASGLGVELAGNVGRPALDLLDEAPADLYVIELSSYQTADLAQGARVVVLTNLYSEHLPWHGSFEAYFHDKLRLATLPGVETVVASGRDRGLDDALSATTAAVNRFGVPGGYDLTERGIVDGDRLVLARADLPLPGDHNALNVCAALEALRAFGIAEPPLPEALRGFRPLPHRLEVIGESGGLTWVNDSISTTPESTVAGLDSFSGAASLTLIAGGLDRGQDFAGLGRVLAQRAIRLITLRDTGPKLAAAASEAGLPADLIASAATVEEAVAVARRESTSGATVLLSPAGASQPHFKDFEARGEAFREAVLHPSRAGSGA
ncbi:MAG: UDP-N-acetylmuramoyl-L-alanine--D-glutamate ligase [Solirubrobacteraceae bacterium]|nr:UDP-N-acetylmuramoyl-L-alanine--D-glutamate ligase [Solirubrobacteraceae bacterium]